MGAVRLRFRYVKSAGFRRSETCRFYISRKSNINSIAMRFRRAELLGTGPKQLPLLGAGTKAKMTPSNRRFSVFFMKPESKGRRASLPRWSGQLFRPHHSFRVVFGDNTKCV